MLFRPGSLSTVLAVGAVFVASSSTRPVASFAPAAAFGVPRPGSFQSGISPSTSSAGIASRTDTALHGRAIKRGKLASNVSPGGVKGTTKKKKKGKNKGAPSSSSSSSSSAASSSASAGGISSKLSEWAASSIDDADGDSIAATAVDVVEAEAEPEAAPRPTKKTGKRKGGGGSGAERKSRQAERRQEESARKALVEGTITYLDDMFNPTDEEGKPKTQRKVEYDLDDIIGKIRTLIDNPNPNGGLRVLTAGQKLRDFRMVWAGSDDAICHLGTGLHNVPLARLQEIFLTMGKGRVDVKEVIRIIGPFPNVRNTLQGGATVMKSRGGVGGGDAAQSRLRIEYDSMVDGTGKEILAGTEQNKRVVDLDVLYADEGAVVCVVPPEEGGEGGADPLGENGSKVLLFFGDEDMDYKLEVLRVA